MGSCDYLVLNPCALGDWGFPWATSCSLKYEGTSKEDLIYLSHSFTRSRLVFIMCDGDA